MRDHPRPVSAGLYGALPATLDALRDEASGGDQSTRDQWLRSLRGVEDERRAGEAAELADERAPLHPMRIYGELAQLLDRDAIVVGDGGDFVSFAGRVVDSYRPGCWLDPGPFGCLGAGPGQALAAKLAHPERQVLLLLGDGALGFSAIEFDTLARHDVAVVAVVGNNGIWALEKHPMESIYGYSVAAELRPETRYDKLAEALGCHGELVREPAQLRPALERAFAAGGPALVNVLTDPTVGVSQAVQPGVARPARKRSRDQSRSAWVSKRKPPAVFAGGFRSRFGSIGTGRGTYQTEPVLHGPDGGRRRCLRLRPDLCEVRIAEAVLHPAKHHDPSQKCQQSNICPQIARTLIHFVLNEIERCSAEDVVLGDLDPLEPEQAHHCLEDQYTGDDRRSTIGV